MSSHTPAITDAALARRDFERILLIKPSSLGDIIHALPVLGGLRRRYPDSRIDWLIASPLAPLLAGHPDITELVLFDRARLGRIGRRRGSASALLRFLRELRARRYDLVVDLQGLFRTGFFSMATRAPVRIGFRASRELAWLFYNRYIPAAEPARAGGEAHAVDRNYAVAQMLGFADQPIRFEIAIPDAARAEVSAMLDAGGVTANQRILLIAPGARWETKRWGDARYRELADAIQAVGDVRCVLVGGSAESDVCASIARTCASPPVNLAGRTTLHQLAAVVARADCVVCNDSAVLHLAVALNRRVVCLIGPTNPARTGPYGRPQDVVQLDLPCSPCYLRTLRKCRHDHRCMRELPVQTVAAAVRRALDATPVTEP